MALTPVDEKHALQIQAGTHGRNAGHYFEYTICNKINEFQYPLKISPIINEHVLTGDPAKLLLNYIGYKEGIKNITSAVAISTGALATSEDGKKWLSINGVSISRCKSDLIITTHGDAEKKFTIGISTKQCNNPDPTPASRTPH